MTEPAPHGRNAASLVEYGAPWADHPRYPERLASLAYRIGVNYILYAMTH